MSSFEVVTCASHYPTEPYYMYDSFLKSLDRYDIKPIVLGFGQPWMGLGSKPKLLKRAIEDGTITADQILFCDAFDVVFAGDPRQIFEGDRDLFLHVGTMWNAEKVCFPDSSLSEEHEPSVSPWRYFNSGVSCGSVDVYLSLLEEMKADEIPDDHILDGKMIEPNDQDLLMRQFLFGSICMDLDRRCDYFQTLCGVSESEIDLTAGDRIRNVVTNTYPIVFHLNGGKEFWKPRLLAKLNL